MVHRRRDRHAGRHFVVEQSSHVRTDGGRELVVDVIVTTAGVAINRAGQVAFQAVSDGGHFVDVFGNDQQRTIAERLGLQAFRIGQELGAVDFQQRILMRVAAAPA